MKIILIKICLIIVILFLTFTFKNEHFATLDENEQKINNINQTFTKNIKNVEIIVKNIIDNKGNLVLNDNYNFNSIKSLNKMYIEDNYNIINTNSICLFYPTEKIDTSKSIFDLWNNNIIPLGWVLCNGNTYNFTNQKIILDNYKLEVQDEINRLSAIYTDILTVPDYRGLFIYGNNSDESFGGEEYVKLEEKHIPPHTHNLEIPMVKQHQGGAPGSYTFVNNKNDDSNKSQTITSYTDINKPDKVEGHDNIPPYRNIYYIIKI